MKPKTYLSQACMLALIVLISAAVLSCKRKDPSVSTLTKENPFIYGYTSGVVSKAAPIRVQFADRVVSAEEIGKDAVKVVSFSPAIAGTATWEDERTLRFDPVEPLAAATTYSVSVDVKKVVKAAKGDNAEFAFEFRTREQYFQRNIDGLRYPDERDYSRLQLKGAVYTADIAASEEVEKILTAKQDGSPLKVSWEHAADQIAHYFTIQDVRRGQKDAEINLAWNGKPLGVNEASQDDVAVPAIGKFIVLDAKVIQDQEQYILVQFSDPLQSDQLLDGLIGLEGFEGSLRYIIEGNTARVYPDQTLTGNFRMNVSDGVRNTKNKRLTSAAVWDINFEAVNPAVRLLGEGVIMPNSNGLMFPFEAVGLKAVDVEVFKIFNNNILQFLQDNPLNGNYDLYKVGRVLLQQKVELHQLNPNASSAKWSRFAFDLSKLIQEDDQAIYSIRIGFRPEYTSLPCMQSGKEGSGNLAAANPFESDEEEPQSIMDMWYGPYGYNEDYSWENRDNPCFPEYYNSDRFVSRNVLASNLGLMAKRGGDDQLLVVVTDLRNANPIGNAQLEVYDFQHQLVGQGATGSDGIAKVPLKGRPFVVVAKQNRERGYLRLEDGEALSLSRFDVDGEVIQKGLKGLIYGERGVWRPGDSIFLNFILEDRAKKLPEDYPITVELFNARGQLQEKRTTGYNVGSIYPLHFTTRPDAPTGNWRVKVKAGGANFERVVKVESVKPNRIEIDLKVGAGATSRNLLSAASMSGELNATWLHGAPASGLKAVVEGQIKSAPTRFAKYPAYAFTDPARRLESAEPKVLFEGTLDGSGHTNIRANLLGDQQAPGMLSAIFRTRVFEPGGDFSTDNLVIPYSPYNAYAGVDIPKNRSGEPRIEIGQSGNIRAVVVDQQGRPLANRTLSAGVYKVEWRWWWDQYEENMSNYNTSTHYNAIERQTISTNAQGEAVFRVKPENWGRYLIRVCDEESGHCSGDFLFVGYPWSDGEADAQFREVASMLSFKADKDNYKVGETATLTIPGGKNGKVLVSLENGSRILQTFWADSKAGENKITFKTTPEMSPTVYANIALIQPHNQVENDLPIRLYGVTPIQVEDPATRLEPQINMPKELKPEQTVSIEVGEKQGKEMAYTLALVDEGLLGLTRYKTPNPRETFYAREALGVHSWDIYDQVLGAFGGRLESVLSIGGDDAVDAGALNNTANRFEPVVMHLGPFSLRAGARNTHQVKIPNYVGAVRVMVVAASKGAYGSAEQRVPVRNPLMILATVPRVLSPGDQFKLPVNVFVNDGKLRNVQVKLQASNGLVTIEGGNSKALTFGGAGDQLTSFDVRVKEGVGIVKFSLTAQAGGETAKQDIEVQVRNPNPYNSEVLSEVLEPGQDWKQAFIANGMAGTRSGILEVSSVPPLNLGERLQFLLQYPYGCIEQTVSAGFPQLFVDRLQEVKPEDQKRISDNVKATIDRIKQFQTSEGGFAYWPGQSTPDHWSTSYTGHFLYEAKAKGYSVPENLLKDWAKFQKKVARMWDPKMPAFGFGSEESHQLNQAYRLYTLAVAGQSDLASMNRLRETAGLKQAARWRLAAAYAVAGKAEVAKQLIANQSTDVADYAELSYTYGSGLRDRALILETLVLLKDQKRAAALVNYISDQLNSRTWYSTQSLAQSLIAVSRYVGDYKPSGTFGFTYQLNDGKVVTAGSKNPVMQIQLPVEKVTKGNLTFKNTSKGKIFVRLILRGQPMPGEEEAVSNDLRISVAFRNMNGTALSAESIPQGRDFIAEVKVEHPASRPVPFPELALSQIFPSGWEIINARMGELSGATQSAYDYQDIRDDRVNTFFDLTEGQSKVYRIQLNAAYQGRFYLPAAACEAMYDNSISAASKGQWVSVTAPRGL